MFKSIGALQFQIVLVGAQTGLDSSLYHVIVGLLELRWNIICINFLNIFVDDS